MGYNMFSHNKNILTVHHSIIIKSFDFTFRSEDISYIVSYILLTVFCSLGSFNSLLPRGGAQSGGKEREDNQFGATGSLGSKEICHN